jgi:hypothetical protein
VQKRYEDATSIRTSGAEAAAVNFGGNFENDYAAALPDDAGRVAMGERHRFLRSDGIEASSLQKSEQAEEAFGVSAWAKRDNVPAIFDSGGRLEGYESDDELQATQHNLPDFMAVVDHLTKTYFIEAGYQSEILSYTGLMKVSRGVYVNMLRLASPLILC